MRPPRRANPLPALALIIAQTHRPAIRSSIVRHHVRRKRQRVSGTDKAERSGCVRVPRAARIRPRAPIQKVLVKACLPKRKRRALRALWPRARAVATVRRTCLNALADRNGDRKRTASQNPRRCWNLTDRLRDSLSPAKHRLSGRPAPFPRREGGLWAPQPLAGDSVGLMRCD